MTLLASLRDWLKAQQLDAVLLSSRQNKQPHLGISTGSGYVVISRESAHILVDSRYYADVEARTQGYQLHLLDAMHTLATIVRQIIADEQLQTLGFEGQQVSWETAHRWQFELNAKLVSATPDVLRQMKNARRGGENPPCLRDCRSWRRAYSPLYSGGYERMRDSR